MTDIQSMEQLGAGPGQNDYKFRYLKLDIVECGETTGTDPKQFICNKSGQTGQSPCRVSSCKILKLN